jgi:large subunit ribosomal protein L32e
MAEEKKKKESKEKAKPTVQSKTDKKIEKKPENNQPKKEIKPDKKSAEPEQKVGMKAEAKKEKPAYKISRSKEASKMAREKSRLEKKKGKFKRQNYGKKKRVPNRWRRPKGIDSGHQNDEKHKPAHPRSGYMTPQKVKGLDVTGYKPIRIFNIDGLKGIDPKTEAVVIASAVGMKKRKELQNIAQERKIQILNYKE